MSDKGLWSQHKKLEKLVARLDKRLHEGKGLSDSEYEMYQRRSQLKYEVSKRGINGAVCMSDDQLRNRLSKIITFNQDGLKSNVACKDAFAEFNRRGISLQKGA